MSHPNILLITSDQQHHLTLGALNPAIHTPHLDRLAAEGMLFERAYCPNPTCTPSRSSMITGQYPSQHGAWTLGTKLPEDAHCVGDDFQAAGYRTALIGKAHFQPINETHAYTSIEAKSRQQDFAFWRDFHGPFYGFQHIELARNHANEANVGQHYALWMEAQGLSDWRDHFRPHNKQQEAAWTLPERYHYNTWIVERSAAQMDAAQAADQPFLLWASFPDPHPPYVVPEPWASMYDPADMEIEDVDAEEFADKPPHFALTQDPDNDAPWEPYRESGFVAHGCHNHKEPKDLLQRKKAIYYGMVSYLDHAVGQLLAHLDEKGLRDDTIVLFTSDHGHFIGEHGLAYKGPFHYEDLVRLPMIARWPGRIPAGARSQALQSLVDLAPTFLSCAGLAIPRTMTGRDQSAVWRGAAKQARDHAVVEFHHEPTTVHLKTLVEERWKMTVYYNQPYGELYDLQSDPEERVNLWADAAHAEERSRMLLRFLHAEMGKEVMWMPRIGAA